MCEKGQLRVLTVGRQKTRLRGPRHTNPRYPTRPKDIHLENLEKERNPDLVGISTEGGTPVVSPAMLACHPAEPPDPLSVKIGAIIIAATALGAIPQLHKLASSGSSAGVSAATSGLTLTFTWFNLLATLTVKAPSLRSCADSVLRCLPSLVDALQQAETALILLAILLLVVSLPTARHRGAAPRRCCSLCLPSARPSRPLMPAHPAQRPLSLRRRRTRAARTPTTPPTSRGRRHPWRMSHSPGAA